MKCLKLSGLLTLVAVLCLAGFSQADQREGAFSVSPMVGYHVFEGDQNTEDDLFAGFSLGYNVSKRWAAEVEVRYTGTETDLSGVPDEDI
ncbi:MAG: porin family protein, partial [Desulfuromonadales bacterium]|nr:porin family protein [Desulfuromonadales bacterium]